MTKVKIYRLYNPDVVSSPGHTIRDLMDDRNFSMGRTCTVLDISPDQLLDLLDGFMEIDEHLSIKLHQMFDVYPSFWLRREARYREYLARKQS